MSAWNYLPPDAAVFQEMPETILVYRIFAYSPDYGPRRSRQDTADFLETKITR